MIFAVVCSAREIYQEYFQNEGYTSTGTMLEIGADDLFGTDKFLYAKDAKVICLLWDSTIVWESPFLGGNSMVFAGDAFFTDTSYRFPERHGVSFITDEGEIVWQKETGIIHSEALDASHDLFAAGTIEGVLWAFSRSGDVLYTYRNKARIDQVIVAPDSSCIVFTDYNDFVKCICNGELIWGRYMGEIPLKGLSNRTLAFSPDSSYFVYGLNKDEPQLVASTPDGKELWSYPLQNVLKAVAVTQDGQYIVAGCHQYVYKFSRDGMLVWKTQIGEDNLRVAVTLSGNYIAVGSSNPYCLFVLDEEGTILWKAKSGNFIRAVFISPNGEYVAFSNNDGELFIFENPLEDS